MPLPTRRPVPMPEDLRHIRLRPADHIVRATLATAKAELDKTNPEQLARKMWPGDAVTPLLLRRDEFDNPISITRAVTSAADTSTTGWSADIATIGLTDFLLNMGPASAASGLLSRALVLTFDRYNALGLPTLQAAASNTSAVGQKSNRLVGSSIPKCWMRQRRRRYDMRVCVPDPMHYHRQHRRRRAPTR